MKQSQDTYGAQRMGVIETMKLQQNSNSRGLLHTINTHQILQQQCGCVHPRRCDDNKSLRGEREGWDFVFSCVWCGISVTLFVLRTSAVPGCQSLKEDKKKELKSFWSKQKSAWVQKIKESEYSGESGGGTQGRGLGLDTLRSLWSPSVACGRTEGPGGPTQLVFKKERV